MAPGFLVLGESATMVGLQGIWSLFATIPLLASTTAAIPLHAQAAQIKRQSSGVESHYDYIVVGGGTSGLTVANRLSAAFPKRKPPGRKEMHITNDERHRSRDRIRQSQF